MKKSIHPFSPFIPSGATSMIIGTIPPQRFCLRKPKLLHKEDVRFYYGSKDNHFWKLLDELFKQKFDYNNSSNAIEDRKFF